MIQATDIPKLHYAFRLLQGCAPGARLARSVQSAAAEELLRTLPASADGASSKAHSRALVAAVAGPNGRVGIDVEYHAPGRRIGAVARYLMQADAADDLAAYRVFTFYEAHFKALGAFPEPALMRAVAAQGGAGYSLEGDVNVLHLIVESDFTLTLVWSGAEL